MSNYGELKREDYYEPRCAVCDPVTGLESSSMQSIPMQRITEKLDEYCARKDFSGAERHLKYWLEEAKYTNDLRGQFSMHNEMMGFYRKQGQFEKACAHVDEAIRVMHELGNEDSPAAGTCYVNCGTVYDSFAMPKEALGYFEKAKVIYDHAEHRDYFKIASLENNMALALADLGRFSEAEIQYRQALADLCKIKGGELEMAITYMNMADAAAMQRGLDDAKDEISNYLKQAYSLILTESLPRNGYYAFVCEKCAPGFNCYGFFDEASEIESYAEQIYKSIAEDKEA